MWSSAYDKGTIDSPRDTTTRGLPKRVIEPLLFVYRESSSRSVFRFGAPLYPIGRTLNNIDQQKNGAILRLIVERLGITLA